MSNRWPGGVIRKTPVTPTGPLQNGTASGVWTLADAAYWTKQGLWPTAGNFLAVEDVFSTWLYTGNSSTQTITNGLNLSGQGGMVWVKQRNSAQSHRLYDTSRGASQMIASNTTSAQANTSGYGVTSFSSSGFTLVDDASNYGVNVSGNTYASWTFRKASKFFDVVTYTGTGSARTIAHNLGSAPGCIIVKRTDTTANWAVYHRSNTSAAYYEKLNLTDAEASDSTVWNSTNPTSSVFSVGTSALTNASGGTYVAYLFGHDTTSDGIIQCGSFTTDGSSNATVSLGWEPQWVLLKGNSAGQPWYIVDEMRGFTVNSSSNVAELQANSTSAEVTAGGISPTSTGFTANAQLTPSTQYIYIAIRRGPMRTPTSGTSVFAPVAWTGSGGVPKFTYSGFAVDAVIYRGKRNSPYTDYTYVSDKIRGYGNIIWTNTSDPETAMPASSNADFRSNTGVTLGDDYGNSTYTNVDWMFRRAPSFFDVVCYTGTGANLTLNHNLGAVPEMMIVKKRSGVANWAVYHSSLGNLGYLLLNSTNSSTTSSSFWNSTTPTATQFYVGTNGNVGDPSTTYVAYLFASCPGVSKVGSYTGTGTTQTINCGFTTGARYVLIKRTDSTGDWYVWDSARGIVAGNDPYLLLNSTASEVTGTDYIDTDNTGFQISSTAPAAINANGGTFIYLAIS